MENIGRALGEFARRLHAKIAVAPSSEPDTGSGDESATPLPPIDDTPETGAEIAQTAAARVARRTAPLAIAALALFVYFRRRR